MLAQKHYMFISIKLPDVTWEKKINDRCEAACVVTWGFSSQHPSVVNSDRAVCTGDAQFIRNQRIDSNGGHCSPTVDQDVLQNVSLCYWK